MCPGCGGGDPVVFSLLLSSLSLSLSLSLSQVARFLLATLLGLFMFHSEKKSGEKRQWTESHKTSLGPVVHDFLGGLRLPNFPLLYSE